MVAIIMDGVRTLRIAVETTMLEFLPDGSASTLSISGDSYVGDGMHFMKGLFDSNRWYE
ncbi:MAG TPA: hypothetical protein VN368_01770 [Candidatus Methylomirabilis sp.]|nr:hypothetical protein [Candidatus Methylomirabilis sp.]